MSFLLLAILQLCAIRGIWDTKDISGGDTSSYYKYAVGWCDQYMVSIAWSPLYTTYLGTIMKFVADPVSAVMLHRVVIVFAASIMTLAVLRRLLPQLLAWLGAAWWTILPINFDTLYEVHLFAVLPLLVMWFLLSYDSRWARGAAVSILGASVVLVRNEMSVAFAILLLVCLTSDILLARRSNFLRDFPRVIAAYGLPLMLAAGLCCFFYSRSCHKFPELSEKLKQKHTLNMAQVYAFGYQQRHPEWTKSPWTDCQELAAEHFGDSLPTLRQMIENNPQAVREHFAWNLGLTGNGLQLLLFNAAAGGVNPDYIPTRLGKTWVWIPTIATFACWITGVILLARNWKYWWQTWIAPRRFVWAGMLAVAAVAPLVVLTQRPRPSYFFGLSVCLMAITAFSVLVITQRVELPNRLMRFSPLVAPLIILIALLTPGHFSTEPGKSQPLYLTDIIRQLQPHSSIYRNPKTIVLQGPHCFQVEAYVGRGQSKAYDYSLLKTKWPADVSFDDFLAQHNINAMYLDEDILQWLSRERAINMTSQSASSPLAHWTLLDFNNEPGRRWQLYQKISDANLEMASLSDTIR